MSSSHNPLDMLQGMWSQLGFQLPGMVAPTLDEGDLEKQIADLRSVENWLRMNLSMLQMTIQNLEMQRTALGTFRSMGQHFTSTSEQMAEAAAESPIPTTLKSFFGNLGDAVAAATSAPQAAAKASTTTAKAGAKKPAAKKTGKPAAKKAAAPRKASK